MNEILNQSVYSVFLHWNKTSAYWAFGVVEARKPFHAIHAKIVTTGQRDWVFY
jgi:hypothetical protein